MQISVIFLLWLFSYIFTKVDGTVLYKNNASEMGKFCSLFLEVSVKAQEKVCTKIHSFSNHISLEKEHYFLRHLQQNVSLPW